MLFLGQCIQADGFMLMDTKRKPPSIVNVIAESLCLILKVIAYVAMNFRKA